MLNLVLELNRWEEEGMSIDRSKPTTNRKIKGPFYQLLRCASLSVYPFTLHSVIIYIV